MKTGKLNPLMDFVNTLCNFVALNLVFLVSCLPVVTIGAALSSLYYVTIKEAREEYGYLVRVYLRELKSNLKNGTIAFAILAVVGAVLLFNISFWFSMGTTFSAIVGGVMLAVMIAWLLTFHYTFPLIGRFVNTPLKSIKNAWALAVLHFKWTLALVLMDVCAVCFCLFFPPMKMIMVLFGFAFLAYCQSFVFKKVFAPYEEGSISPEEKQGLLERQAEMMSGTSQL